MIARECFVDVEHLFRFFARFRFRFVNGVTFLPEEFGRAQENAWPHFPAHDIGPLVDENGQIAIRLHPLRVTRADDCLRSGPND